ncbi:LysR substrate-binding domain-containing protein [Frigidibacter sp. RF13]|uniref:LysR substrate-binding domain-containing protein n=1 Tax=Frigidibacter sp. RF13 TaxID=2997340 RepID=UPI00226F5513|nr:LysR substrate-binding domain-containing protein [Frigidibacter sp. RF13]MCY1127058.1 LysR substrate-binding domain-containing protein [Frigidibacter sp. RF13]
MPARVKPSLPPLAAIRAFEAAARQGSFTAAGEELGMTQAAVSYQIKALEDRVGFALFRRRARGVELTPDGARLATRAEEALDILRQAFADARQAHDETLVISVLPTIAQQIIAPRLGAFQIAHPTIMTRVEVESRLVDLLAGEATVAIRAGLGKWPGLATHYLLPGDYAPMISPAFIARNGRPAAPADLLSMPLIDADDEGWAGWFRAAGVAPPCCRSGGRTLFGTQALTAQAAIAGHGACLLNPYLFRAELARGDLIQPFATVWREAFSMYLVYPERRRNAPAIRAFRDWVLAEFQAIGA